MASKYIPTASLDPGVITKGIADYDAHAPYLRSAVNAFEEAHGGLIRLGEARLGLAKNGALVIPPEIS